jgi:hypothetical protein
MAVRSAGASLRMNPGFRVQGSGFRVQGSGFRVQGSGCRVQGAGFRVKGAGCKVQGAGCRVQGAGCRVQGAGRILAHESCDRETTLSYVERELNQNFLAMKFTTQHVLYS